MRAASNGLQEQKRGAAASMQKLPLGHSTLPPDGFSVIVGVIHVLARTAARGSRYHSLPAAAAVWHSFVHFADDYALDVCGGGGHYCQVHLLDEAPGKRLSPIRWRRLCAPRQLME